MRACAPVQSFRSDYRSWRRLAGARAGRAPERAGLGREPVAPVQARPGGCCAGRAFFCWVAGWRWGSAVWCGAVMIVCMCGGAVRMLFLSFLLPFFLAASSVCLAMRMYLCIPVFLYSGISVSVYMFVRTYTHLQYVCMYVSDPIPRSSLKNSIQNMYIRTKQVLDMYIRPHTHAHKFKSTYVRICNLTNPPPPSAQQPTPDM